MKLNLEETFGERVDGILKFEFRLVSLCMKF